jgi:hypothetical protein
LVPHRDRPILIFSTPQIRSPSVIFDRRHAHVRSLSLNELAAHSALPQQPGINDLPFIAWVFKIEQQIGAFSLEITKEKHAVANNILAML